MKVLEFVKKLHREESGQDLVEYALVLVAITGAAVTGSATLASALTGAMTKMKSTIDAALTPA